MTRFYDLAARICGVGAVVCATLGALAYTGSARADTMSDCQAYCEGMQYTGGDLYGCTNYCYLQGGPPPCTPSNCVGCSAPPPCLAQVCRGFSCGCLCNGVPPLQLSCGCQ